MLSKNTHPPKQQQSHSCYLVSIIYSVPNTGHGPKIPASWSLHRAFASPFPLPTPWNLLPSCLLSNLFSELQFCLYIHSFWLSKVFNSMECSRRKMTFLWTPPERWCLFLEIHLQLNTEEQGEEMKWSHYSQAAKLLIKSTRLRHEEMILLLV